MAGSAARIRALESKNAQQRLSKEQLLTPRKLEEDVFVEGLGGTVKIRTLSHAQRQDIQKMSMGDDGEFDADRMTMLSIVAAIVEPDLTEADIESLRQQDVSIIDELQVAIGSLNLVGRASDLKKGSRKTRT